MLFLSLHFEGLKRLKHVKKKLRLSGELQLEKKRMHIDKCAANTEHNNVLCFQGTL